MEDHNPQKILNEISAQFYMCFLLHWRLRAASLRTQPGSTWRVPSPALPYRCCCSGTGCTYVFVGGWLSTHCRQLMGRHFVLFFPLSRMKPVSSSNDVAMDALDFDRMKQVSWKVFSHLSWRATHFPPCMRCTSKTAVQSSGFLYD